MTNLLPFGGLKIGPVFQHAEQSRSGSGAQRKTIDTVVIPTAGWGTRMGNLTHSVSKGLLPLGDHTLIGHAVLEAQRAGAKKIVMVCSPSQLEQYKQQFSPTSDNAKGRAKKTGAVADELTLYQKLGQMITYVEQTEAKGLGHAVLQAKGHVEGSFGVILPDDAILNSNIEQTGLESLVRTYQGGLSIACMEVDPSDAHRYGIFDLIDDVQSLDSAPIQQIRGVVEKPTENAPSNFAIMGRYILPTEIFDHLAQEKIGAGDEIQLTDAMEALIEDGVTAYAAKYEGERLDCGTPEGYKAAFGYVLSVEAALVQLAPDLKPDALKR